MNRIITVEEDSETGDLILPLPEDMLNEVGWKPGDILIWTDLKNGSWSLTKKDTENEIHSNS